MPRLRFSLRAFLLLLFIGSLIGSNLFTAWQLDKVRKDNSQMAKELGRLVVKDPNKIHIVALPTYEDMLWRWRIYVPQGRSLNVYELTRDIPDKGFGEHSGSTTLQDGEYLLTVAIRPNRSGQWQLTVGTEHRSASLGIADADSTWLVDSPGWSSEQAGVGTTEVIDPDQPFVLLRVRAMEKTPGGGSISSDTPTAKGVMLWIK